jgi:branched-chain amino acid transport system substrate-binding protein
VTRGTRAWAAAMTMALLSLTAACGQYPGVDKEGVPLGAAGPTPTAQAGGAEGLTGLGGSGGALGGGGSSAGVAGSGGSTGFAAGSSSGGGSGGSASTSGSSSSGGGGGGGPTGGPTGGNTTGVSGSTIKIGIHAPITGAAPVPQSSFNSGKDLYWRYLKRIGKSIAGRDVEVVFRDDQYNPSHAVAVCKEMVQKEHVFALVGIAGTDQIQACARYAASAGVPYLSAGVTQNGLTGLRNYFAMWMSYVQQGPLLADELVSTLGAKQKKNGMVWFQTPNFVDAHNSFISAMRSRRARVQYDRTVSKTASTADAQAVATQLKQLGIKNVYVLTSPKFFLELASAAATQNYRPQWVGLGITMGINTVARVGCRNNAIQGARFFSPYPGIADADRFDPAFHKAGGQDDIEWGLWGASKVIGRMLVAAGHNLTRERFVYFAERVGASTGVFPPVHFSPSDHFGGNAMHVLRANCKKDQWVTARAFVSHF